MYIILYYIILYYIILYYIILYYIILLSITSYCPTTKAAVPDEVLKFQLKKISVNSFIGQVTDPKTAANVDLNDIRLVKKSLGEDATSVGKCWFYHLLCPEIWDSPPQFMAVLTLLKCFETIKLLGFRVPLFWDRCTFTMKITIRTGGVPPSCKTVTTSRPQDSCWRADNVPICSSVCYPVNWMSDIN